MSKPAFHGRYRAARGTVHRATAPSLCLRIRSGLPLAMTTPWLLRQGKGAPKRPFDDRRLGRVQIDGRHPAALALFELVSQLLAFIEAVHTSPLDSGDMNENVSAPSRRLDK